MIKNLIITDKVKSLQNKSSVVFSIFTQTLNDLTSINQQVGVEKHKRADNIAKLNAECAELETVEKSNTNMINKINQFLN